MVQLIIKMKKKLEFMDKVRIVNVVLLVVILIIIGVNWWNLTHVEYPDVIVQVNAEVNYTYDWEQAEEAVNDAIIQYCTEACTDLYLEYHPNITEIEHEITIEINCDDEGNCTCLCDQEINIEVGSGDEEQAQDEETKDGSF